MMLNKINYTSEFPKITEETTIKELQAIHKRIWQYVVDNGEKPVTPYIANCAVCEWVYVTYGMIYCAHCPINWPDRGRCCGGSLDLYSMWSVEKQPSRKSAIAKDIRDVEFKEVNECQK